MLKTVWFTRGDIDGFFGLFIDNLLQLMLIAVLCTGLCGMPPALVYSTILPGAALSVFIGNIFYAWQARQLARKTGRNDVTALPFGINTPSLVSYVLLIMMPIYQETKDAHLAWQAGLFACLISGVLECAGVLCGDWVRRHTPRAALLCALAGVAITFISMGFVFQIFASPALAIVPMLIILFSYAGKVRWPGGLPGGLVAVVAGTALAWGLKFFGMASFSPPSAIYAPHWALPRPVFGDMLAFLVNGKGWKYFSVIFPMGLFNIIGSLQNLESAEAAGDRFETRSSLLVNGVASLAAAILGSPFPTTIYIGHPGWKAMGARWGYSALNGAVIAVVCLTGTLPLVLKIVPLEVTLGILLWVGVIITAQSFQSVPKAHALAVALGLLPSLAAWALLLVETSLQAAGTSLAVVATKFGPSLYVHGVAALAQGFLLSSMILAAMLVCVIEQNFRRAAIWSALAAVFSFFGLIHSYAITASGVINPLGWNQAPAFALSYLAGALILLGLSMNFTR